MCTSNRRHESPTRVLLAAVADPTSRPNGRPTRSATQRTFTIDHKFSFKICDLFCLSFKICSFKLRSVKNSFSDSDLVIIGAPRHKSMLELKRMAENRKAWNRMSHKFKKYGVVKYMK